MVQGYYTLEEASRILGIDAEELSQKAQKREVRAFADRGTWRFRTQDIEELARQRGMSSTPELQLGEAPKAKPHDSPARRHAAQPADDAGVFDFSLGEGDQVEIGREPLFEAPGGSKRSAGKPSSKRGIGGGRTPPPKPGSDSDVRLVAEGSDVGFQLAPDSKGKPDSKVKPDSSKVKLGEGPASGARPASKKTQMAPGSDSGVRLVPMGTEADSDVKIVPDSGEHEPVPPAKEAKPGTDSDIRIEPAPGPKSGVRLGERAPEDSVLTEEIDLDAELRKAELEAKGKKPKSKPRAKPSQLPSTSPFELSDSDLEAPKSTNVPSTAKRKKDSSSDFELKPASETDSSDFELAVREDSSSPLDVAEESPVLQIQSDEDVDLGVRPTGKAGHDSGINLEQPADAGISLEQGGSSDEIEFELSLDSAESTPKPAKATSEVDSDSEFELTLDDSGGLAPLEEESKSPEASDQEKDIFETDFEVPPLEDESGSEAVALEGSDTDLESSDFDLALSDEDVATEEDSGSQVVVLEDEEQVDEAAATVARPSRHAVPAAGEDEEAATAENLVSEEEVLDEEEPVRVRRAAPAAAAADWGVLPAAVLIPCVLIMSLVGLMGFELLHTMWGYHQPYKVSGVLIRPLSEMFVSDLPKD